MNTTVVLSPEGQPNYRQRDSQIQSRVRTGTAENHMVSEQVAIPFCYKSALVCASSRHPHYLDTGSRFLQYLVLDLEVAIEVPREVPLDQFLLH